MADQTCAIDNPDGLPLILIIQYINTLVADQREWPIIRVELGRKQIEELRQTTKVGHTFELPAIDARIFGHPVYPVPLDDWLAVVRRVPDLPKPAA